MRKLEAHDRAKKYDLMGGTNAPIRKNWQKQLKRGRAEGSHETMWPIGSGRDQQTVTLRLPGAPGTCWPNLRARPRYGTDHPAR